ncbi:MAG: GGDEF domain-containing protein [Methylobacterium sp.]|nr:MAG: GGDEF domain-containing protein [Methylobacterium sp.]
MLMAQQESSHLALHCSLTGLPNRNSFKARLKAAERNASVLFLDLDGFKAVNDQHGHPAGDALLTAVGERIRGCVPDPADVARLGGDEFAILVHADDERTIAAIATRLIAEVARPYALPTGLVVRVGLSIGIATRRDADTDPMLLLPEADQALYEAKRAGKGTYRWFQPANDADLSSQVRELRDMLPKAQTDREHGFEAGLSVTRA